MPVKDFKGNPEEWESRYYLAKTKYNSVNCNQPQDVYSNCQFPGTSIRKTNSGGIIEIETTTKKGLIRKYIFLVTDAIYCLYSISGAFISYSSYDVNRLYVDLRISNDYLRDLVNGLHGEYDFCLSKNFSKKNLSILNKYKYFIKLNKKYTLDKAIKDANNILKEDIENNTNIFPPYLTASNYLFYITPINGFLPHGDVSRFLDLYATCNELWLYKFNNVQQTRTNFVNEVCTHQCGFKYTSYPNEDAYVVFCRQVDRYILTFIEPAIGKYYSEEVRPIPDWHYIRMQKELGIFNYTEEDGKALHLYYDYRKPKITSDIGKDVVKIESNDNKTYYMYICIIKQVIENMLDNKEVYMYTVYDSVPNKIIGGHHRFEFILGFNQYKYTLGEPLIFHTDLSFESRKFGIGDYFYEYVLTNLGLTNSSFSEASDTMRFQYDYLYTNDYYSCVFYFTQHSFFKYNNNEDDLFFFTYSPITGITYKSHCYFCSFRLGDYYIVYTPNKVEHIYTILCKSIYTPSSGVFDYIFDIFANTYTFDLVGSLVVTTFNPIFAYAKVDDLQWTEIPISFVEDNEKENNSTHCYVIDEMYLDARLSKIYYRPGYHTDYGYITPDLSYFNVTNECDDIYLLESGSRFKQDVVSLLSHYGYESLLNNLNSITLHHDIGNLGSIASSWLNIIYTHIMVNPSNNLYNIIVNSNITFYIDNFKLINFGRINGHVSVIKVSNKEAFIFLPVMCYSRTIPESGTVVMNKTNDLKIIHIRIDEQNNLQYEIIDKHIPGVSFGMYSFISLLTIIKDT